MVIQDMLPDLNYHEFFEVISNPLNTEEILLTLAKSLQREVLYLVPNDRALVRVNKIGLIDLLIQASRQRNVKIKIICPLSDINSDIIRTIINQAPDIQIIPGKNTSSGIFIVDDLKMLRVEIKDADANEFSKAIGFALYSNSKASVSSFKMFFELLWNACIQNEELMRIDKMKDEFINVAAHEFRTPIQSVLGYLELAKADSEYNTIDKKRGGLIEAAYRNAVRLHRLTKNILEVTRIESQTLYLNKKMFDLNKLASSIVGDLQNNTAKLSRKYGSSDTPSNEFIVRISDAQGDDELNVDADEERITEVLVNLLDNAVKSTKHGIISVTTEKDKVRNQAYVRVRDSGSGVHPELMTRLFTKFASKSSGGTGLGLYISKSIVEAHGGKIWFENNQEDRGSTFGFSLPIQERR
jgi:two-component system, OmpR family, sensor histidine kinase VicK